MNRRDLFKMIPGIALLPMMRWQEPVNFYPERITPLYMMAVGNQVVMSNSQMYGMGRPVLSITDPARERLKQRIIDEQRQGR